MADEPQAKSTSRWLLILAAVVVVLLLLWQFGMFGTGQEDVAPTYEADATDASGGELIVRDPDPAEVQVDEPDTPMTPVPAENPAAAE
jgi:hypothetical protein